MMDDELDIVDELETDVPRRRSNFLMVLCILTWVGSGLSILYHIYAYLFTSGVSGFVRQYSGKTGVNWVVLLNLIGIFAPFFTIVGAVLMWRLKRMGFFIYAFGQVVPILASFYWTLGIMDISGPGILVFAILPNAVQIGFMILYATHFKELK